MPEIQAHGLAVQTPPGWEGRIYRRRAAGELSTKADVPGPAAPPGEQVFPVVHVEYALTEVEYFAGIVVSPANADLAYDGYLLGHAAWFGTSDGATVLDHLRRRAATA